MRSGPLWASAFSISPRSTRVAFQRRHQDIQTGQYVLLTVQDTGIGMDKKVLERACEPFFTTKEPGKGTGLGLAMVHGIIGQHNGVIEIDSKVGQGATFSIRARPGGNCINCL